MKEFNPSPLLIGRVNKNLESVWLPDWFSRNRLLKMKREITRNSLFSHYKKPRILYRIVGMSLFEEDNTIPLISYEMVGGLKEDFSKNNSTIWTRTFAEFFKIFQGPIPRFYNVSRYIQLSYVTPSNPKLDKSHTSLSYCSFCGAYTRYLPGYHGVKCVGQGGHGCGRITAFPLIEMAGISEDDYLFNCFKTNIEEREYFE